MVDTPSRSARKAALLVGLALSHVGCGATTSGEVPSAPTTALTTADNTSAALSAGENTTGRTKEPTDLALQFADAFNGTFDPDHWVKRTGNARNEGGSCLLEAFRDPPPGPGPFTFALISLKQKYFAPRLTGVNGAEITLDKYIFEKDYPKELDEKIVRDHRMGWGLSIASWPGQVGQNGPQDRGLQLHIDWLGRRGLFVHLVRTILPEDAGKYPNDNVWRTPPEEFFERLDKLIEEGPYISEPCFVMATRIYRPAAKFLEKSHRFGLYLTDDAKTVYWTLDGAKMDSFDVGEYFASNPAAIKDGLYISILATGVYQKNVWKMDDLRVYSSNAAPHSTN